MTHKYSNKTLPELWGYERSTLPLGRQGNQTRHDLSASLMTTRQGGANKWESVVTARVEKEASLKPFILPFDCSLFPFATSLINLFLLLVFLFLLLLAPLFSNERVNRGRGKKYYKWRQRGNTMRLLRKPLWVWNKINAKMRFRNSSLN